MRDLFFAVLFGLRALNSVGEDTAPIEHGNRNPQGTQPSLRDSTLAESRPRIRRHNNLHRRVVCRRIRPVLAKAVVGIKIIAFRADSRSLIVPPGSYGFLSGCTGEENIDQDKSRNTEQARLIVPLQVFGLDRSWTSIYFNAVRMSRRRNRANGPRTVTVLKLFEALNVFLIAGESRPEISCGPDQRNDKLTRQRRFFRPDSMVLQLPASRHALGPESDAQAGTRPKAEGATIAARNRGEQ